MLALPSRMGFIYQLVRVLQKLVSCLLVAFAILSKNTKGSHNFGFCSSISVEMPFFWIAHFKNNIYASVVC